MITDLWVIIWISIPSFQIFKKVFKAIIFNYNLTPVSQISINLKNKSSMLKLRVVNNRKIWSFPKKDLQSSLRFHQFFKMIKISENVSSHSYLSRHLLNWCWSYDPSVSKQIDIPSAIMHQMSEPIWLKGVILELEPRVPQFAALSLIVRVKSPTLMPLLIT